MKMEMRLSSCGNAIIKITEDLKHQPATSATTTVENVKTQVPGMLTLMDADNVVCACGILGLDVPEQKKGNLKLLLKHF